MKKYAIMAMMALALGFTACEDIDEASGKPQVNPQEPIFTLEDLTTEVPQATATAVDFAAYSGEGQANAIPVLKVVRLENFPEGFKLEGVMEYAADNTFAGAKSIDLEYNAETGEILAPVEAWENAHIALFTKNPQKVDATNIRIALYAVNGTAKVRIVTPDGTDFFGTRAIDVTPLPAEHPIEQSYVMVVNGTEYPMDATNPANVYDPPTFAVSVTVEEGQTLNCTFRSASGKVYGMGEEGTLVEGSTTPVVLTEMGPQVVTINMEELTYKIQLAVKELYAYSSSANQGNLLATSDFISYKGYAGFSTAGFMLANEKKLAPSMKWGAALDGDTPIEGKLALGSTTKIPLAQAGCYFIDVNLPALEYTATYVEFELIGDWNGWSEGFKMTPDGKYTKWTGEADMHDGLNFKIRCNGGWTYNLGGSFDDLVQDGGNLEWNEGDGKYAFTLDLSKVPYTLTYVKK